MKQMIVDLTYWQSNGLSKRSAECCFTLLASGGGYGICVMEIEDGDNQSSERQDK